MKTSTSKSLTFHFSAYQYSILKVTVCAVVLGLGVIGLVNVRAQSPSRPPAEQAKPLLSQEQMRANTVSQSVVVNWPNEVLKRTTFDDYLLSLRRDERMTAKVLSIQPSGNGSPQAIIVIYGGHGQVIACIGSAKACKEFKA